MFIIGIKDLSGNGPYLMSSDIWHSAFLGYEWIIGNQKDTFATLLKSSQVRGFDVVEFFDLYSASDFIKQTYNKYINLITPDDVVYVYNTSTNTETKIIENLQLVNTPPTSNSHTTPHQKNISNKQDIKDRWKSVMGKN